MAELGFLLAAGAGIALFDWLGSKGQQQTVTDNVLTDMSVSSTYESDTSCVSSLAGSQTIDIQAGGGSYPASKLQDSGSSCDLCQKALSEIVQMRDTLEQAAVDASIGRYQAQTASLEVSLAMGGASSGIDKTGISTLGGCELMCKDIVIFGVHQSQVFKANTNCKVDTDNKDDISQKLVGKIKSSLKNQEDIIGQLEDAFTSNTESITNSIASRMNETLTTVVRQQLVNSAISVQNFNVGLEGTSGDTNTHSIYVNTVSQSFTSKSVATLNVNNQVNNTLRQSADYSIAQQLLNKNDTIGDITKDFVGVIDTMGGFMDTLTGDLLIIIGAMLALFVLMVFGFYMWSPRARALIDSVTTVGAQYVANKVSAKTGVNFSGSAHQALYTSYPTTPTVDTSSNAFLTSSAFM
jgi:hypothetical protein